MSNAFRLTSFPLPPAVSGSHGLGRQLQRVRHPQGGVQNCHRVTVSPLPSLSALQPAVRSSTHWPAGRLIHM